MIIGVVGFISSGKGTVADLLVSEHSFQKMSFADPVKDATAAIFGWSRSALEGDTDASRKFREVPDKYWSKKIGNDFSPRLALQLVGTECFRDVIHHDIWVYALEKRLASAVVDPATQHIVIPDTRFPNEIKFIQEHGGKVIRVKRGPEPPWFDLARNNPIKMGMDHPEVHYSEWAWCGSVFDYVIENNSSFDDLKKSVKKILKDLDDCSTIGNIEDLRKSI